ncbi:MAG: hypothetical protein RXR03_07675 [Thermocladium sp.]
MHEKARAMLGVLLLEKGMWGKINECFVTVTEARRGEARPKVPPLPTPHLLMLSAAINARRFMRPDTNMRVATITCTMEAVRDASPGPGILQPVPGTLVMQVDGEAREVGTEELEVRLRSALLNMTSYAAVSIIDVGDVVRGTAALIAPFPDRLRLKEEKHGLSLPSSLIMAWIRRFF